MILYIIPPHILTISTPKMSTRTGFLIMDVGVHAYLMSNGIEMSPNTHLISVGVKLPLWVKKLEWYMGSFYLNNPNYEKMTRKRFSEILTSAQSKLLKKYKGNKDYDVIITGSTYLEMYDKMVEVMNTLVDILNKEYPLHCDGGDWYYTTRPISSIRCNLMRCDNYMIKH